MAIIPNGLEKFLSFENCFTDCKEMNGISFQFIDRDIYLI